MSNVSKVIEALRGMKSGLLVSEIAERSKLKRAQVTSALTYLKTTNTVIKHAGESTNKSRYTLNPDATPDALSASKPDGAKRGRPAKTLRDIAAKHIQRGQTPLAITHISTTFDVVMEIAEEDIDGMDQTLRSALNAHREAIELARSL